MSNIVATVPARHKRTPVDKPLNGQQQSFIDEYMKDRNGRQAAIRAGYTSRTADNAASTLLARPNVRAEVNRRLEEYSQAAGIERIKLLELLKSAVFCDVRKVFAPNGGILPPDQWPDDVANVITGYNAGTVTAAEKITLESRTELAFKLLDEIRPVGERKHDAPSVTLNIQNLLAVLSGPPVQT